MKGTYIKVLNEVIFDVLDEIKAQRNKKVKESRSEAI
jgi:transcriptional pleiotropic repressor